MAKLYFRYGAMGSSKSENILMVRYNYEERGQYAVLLKPRTDSRDGERKIQSRMGLSASAEYVDEFLKEISTIWKKENTEPVVRRSSFSDPPDVFYHPLLNFQSKTGISDHAKHNSDEPFWYRN